MADPDGNPIRFLYADVHIEKILQGNVHYLTREHASVLDMSKKIDSGAFGYPGCHHTNFRWYLTKETYGA